jgi:hypothetical protein
MFPQSSSSRPVIAGQQFWRLKTELLSAGDIYESEVSALGVVIGPDSDLSSVQVSYLDSESPTFLSTVNITPDRNITGRIDARNDTVYKGPGRRPGRLLISSNDLWDPTLRPNGYDIAGEGSDTIEFIRPVIDVLQYFQQPPSITPSRSDKTYRFEYFEQAPDAVNGVTWLAIPAYGRKSGSFTLNNRHAINTVRATLYGWRLQTSTPSDTSVTRQLFTDDLLFNASAVYQYKSSVDGLWDIILLALGGGAGPFPYSSGFAFPVVATLSDDAL